MRKQLNLKLFSVVLDKTKAKRKLANQLPRGKRLGIMIIVAIKLNVVTSDEQF